MMKLRNKKAQMGLWSALASAALVIAACGGSGSSSGGGGAAGTASISGVVNGFAATAAVMPGEGSTHSARMIAQILNFLSPPLAAGPGGAGVTVQVQGSDPLIETTTDANGQFTLEGVPVPDSGEVTLLFIKDTVQVSFGLNGIAPGSQIFIGEIDIIDNGVVDARVEVQNDVAQPPEPQPDPGPDVANDNASDDNSSDDTASEDDDSNDNVASQDDDSGSDDDTSNDNTTAGDGTPPAAG